MPRSPRHPPGSDERVAALRGTYLANRATEATLRSILAMAPVVASGRVPDDAEIAAATAEERRATGGLLRTLAQEAQLVEALRGQVRGQGVTLRTGSAEDIRAGSAATERASLTLREAMRGRLQLARLLTRDGVPPAPSAQLGAAAAHIALADQAVRVAATAALEELRRSQSALASALQEWEETELRSGHDRGVIPDAPLASQAAADRGDCPPSRRSGGDRHPMRAPGDG